jgi:hypothetical protein
MSACVRSEGGDADDELFLTEEDLSEPLYFEPIGRGQSTAVLDTIEAVIRTPESLEDYLRQLRPPYPFRPVDFSQAMVILVAVPAPGGGYSVDIESVEMYEEQIRVEYVVTIPGDDCVTSIGQNTPFVATLVRRAEGEVRFTHRVEEMLCGLERNF